MQTTITTTSVFTQQRESHTKYDFSEKTSNRKKWYAVFVGASVAATYGIYRYSIGKEDFM